MGLAHSIVRGVGTVVLKAASGATVRLEHVHWEPRLTHSLFRMCRALRAGARVVGDDSGLGF